VGGGGGIPDQFRLLGEKKEGRGATTVTDGKMIASHQPDLDGGERVEKCPVGKEWEKGAGVGGVACLDHTHFQR